MELINTLAAVVTQMRADHEEGLRELLETYSEALSKFEAQKKAIAKSKENKHDEKQDPKHVDVNEVQEIKEEENVNESANKDLVKPVTKVGEEKQDTAGAGASIPGMVPDSPDSHSEEVVTPAFLKSLTKDLTAMNETEAKVGIKEEVTGLKSQEKETSNDKPKLMKNLTPGSASPSRYFFQMC